MIIAAISSGVCFAIAGAALIAGSGLSFYLWQLMLRNRKNKIITEAEAEAEVIKKEKILQAKERFLQLKTEHEKVINERNNRISQSENRIRQKELTLSQKLEEAQRRKSEADSIRESLAQQMELLEKKNEELSRMHRQKVEQLETILRTSRPMRPKISLSSRSGKRHALMQCHISMRFSMTPR